MKNATFILSLAAGALALGAAFADAQAQGEHKMVSPNQIEWRPGPPTLPSGAQVAVLYGDPSKEGLFAMRLKFPAGYRVPPHMHPKPEVVTVVSGTFQVGMGDKADKAKAQALPAGSIFVAPPGMAHFAYADEETVVQLNSVGPFGITYVNEADDPRKRTQ